MKALEELSDIFAPDFKVKIIKGKQDHWKNLTLSAFSLFINVKMSLLQPNRDKEKDASTVFAVTDDNEGDFTER